MVSSLMYDRRTNEEWKLSHPSGKIPSVRSRIPSPTRLSSFHRVCDFSFIWKIRLTHFNFFKFQRNYFIKMAWKLMNDVQLRIFCSLQCWNKKKKNIFFFFIFFLKFFFNFWFYSIVSIILLHQMVFRSAVWFFKSSVTRMDTDGYHSRRC